MTTEHLQTDKSKLASNNVDSPGQMRGWFKLIETIRKTEPPGTPPSESSKPPSLNSRSNGHRSKSPESVHIYSPHSKSPNLNSPPPLTNLPSTPRRSIDDESVNAPESKTKRRSTRHKKITIRKSARSKEINPPSNEDTIPTDNHQRKRQSIDLSSTIPLATDLQSLPGHNQDELRDQRFLDYSDFNTLSTHMNTCLYIEKKPFSTSFFAKKHIFKTRHNILTKIFKLSYLKTHQKCDPSTIFTEKSESKPPLPSSTSISFKTDWSVNRRNASSHRHEPKNVFHILQLNPKKQLFPSDNNHPSSTNLSIEEQHQIDQEHMKDLLIRTYYPHFHTAFQYGYYFGSKSKMPVKQQHFKPTFDADESMTIKLKSPPSIFQRQSKKRGRKSKYRKSRERPRPITSSERRVSEEIPPVNAPIPTQIPSSPIISNHRKRKMSPVNERKKKPLISIPSPELIANDPELSHSDSEDDVLPDELPKQNFIKNGLRSNYYKTTAENDAKSTNHKNRSSRRRHQSSGSLPSFYTGIFESNDEKFSYIHYQLPFDIYWFSQKQSTKSPDPPKKKKSIERKISYKNFSRNTPTDSPRLIHRFSPHRIRNIEDLTPHEREIVSQSSIFLKRNLRRLKEKYERKTKEQKQQIDEQQPLPQFIAQNYYHAKISDENEFSNLSHKDLFNLFFNYIRRSHFAKTGRCSIELIDPTCSYAQLAQLTLILSEIFDLLLNYKCHNSDIYPSNALKKCPSKRLFPMYYELILQPMDLTMIRTKLDHGDYLLYQSFEEDLLLLFTNAIRYCGEDSDVGRAVKELEQYFRDRLKLDYQSTITLFRIFTEEDFNQKNLGLLTDFIARLHAKDVIAGQIREILAEIIFNIDLQQTPASDVPRIIKNNWIVHCRCGSTYDEVPLVQCYACQLWQHVSCVVIHDSFRPYYCFECHPTCEAHPSSCLKMNIRISQDTQSSYSTLTRSDGLLIRINECYLVKKQDENAGDDIFSIERLWIDENQVARASGFYYLRPCETFHEANRKFFPNEIFRFPSTNDSIDIESIIRPCYVFDPSTFCKGKPIPEYTSRILPIDLFVCEYRVDKSARTFTRLPKSKHVTINTKTYCFDNYIEKLSIKRDYQSHQKEHHPPSHRRRSSTYSNKLTVKQLEEKSSHIDGLIEKIYCHFHHPNLIPQETKFSLGQFVDQPIVDRNNNRGSKRLREKPAPPPIKSPKKRRTRSDSSEIISSLLNELIESISSSQKK